MKTMKNIIKIFLILVTAAVFFSCDNPVNLGSMLDLNGPVINITSPSPNKSVPSQFDLEGDIFDNSGIDRMLIKTVINSQDFPRQWRYFKDKWEKSEDYGESWSAYSGANWNGTQNSAEWLVSIDMEINGVSQDGEYTFFVQAWDKGQITDDNSFKAITLIIDHDPPKVDISNPYIYRGINAYADVNNPLKKLHDINDDQEEIWQDPAYLGKFITQEFDLKWQIEDNYNIWSIDLRFYPYDANIDNDPDTELPASYIYKYNKNLPPPPPSVSPQDYIRPNGSVKVPNLTSPAGIYDDGGEILKPVIDKTTVKIVAVCYDAAGNPNQEKTLGYFIYWPKANTPWIVFTEGMVNPYDKNYFGKPVGPDAPGTIENDVYMVYPGRSVKATAYQAHGVKEVKYSLYKLDITGNLLNSSNQELMEEDIIHNVFYSGIYTNIFPWEIKSPAFTGYYLIHAQAYSSQGVASEEYIMIFRVQDITFPDFPESPLPAASNPLFMDINNNKIKIRGIVADATEVVSLCMVWINPQSKNYAAMSQLQYFRDKDYGGWRIALGLTPGNNDYEGIYDGGNNPNRVWKLKLTPAGTDNDTNRRLFRYEQEIDLGIFNIGIEEGRQPLRSQIFLLRAENPDKKCTIITYAPQGDTLAPVITISDVKITGSQNITCIPNQYKEIQSFKNGDNIIINGTWKEDSVEFLDAATYFLPNFNIKVNNQTLTAKPTLSYDTPSSGTWTITSTVGPSNTLTEDNLKDTLVISVDAKDIGGNRSEIGCSWLIASDKLRLMRITAIDGVRDADGKEVQIGDGTYTNNQKIDIVLEFSKPVNLAYPGGSKPELILSATASNSTNARAVYKDGQTNQNSRQYFEYIIAGPPNNHNTGANYLNVIGIYYNNTAYFSSNAASNNYAMANYPFAWYKDKIVENPDGTTITTREEVRITMQGGKDGTAQEGSGSGYYARTLPTTTVTSNSDYQFTLTAAKHLLIDTNPPSVTGVSTSTFAGDYDIGNIIAVTLTFSKPVAKGAAAPYLTLKDVNGSTYGSSFNKNTTSSSDVNNSSSSGTITFMYTIQPGDTTKGNRVALNGFGGSIIDLAGNPLAIVPNTTLTGTTTGTLTDTGIYIDTIPVSETPVVRLLKASVNNPTDNDSTNISTTNLITNDVNGTIHKGFSGSTNKTLSTLYNQNLYLAIQGDNSGGSHRLSALEYSFDGGNTWTTAQNTLNNAFQISYRMGSFTITARQRNKVGNTSVTPSSPITFSWDSGNIIDRVTSTSAKGTYTNNTGNGGNREDTINITVALRKQVKFDTLPTISLNVIPTPMVTATYTASTLTDELIFSYKVGTNHNTPTSQALDVTSIAISGTARDSNNVKVNDYLILPSTALLTAKEIYVKTGPLNVITNGTAFTNSGDALEITFNNNIVKGEGFITIEQSSSGYRLPAVLTESQFGRYSNIANVNDYYTRGSNGFVNGKADTSTKYILRYDVDTADTANAPSGTGNTIQVLAERFRQAEQIKLSINAQAVEVSGNKLIVRLSGDNAPQVPGANYRVSYPAKFVYDTLDVPCPAASGTTDIPLGGIAEPFIRINKKQETITVNATPSSTLPKYTAVQPFQANVRLDCRTPDSSIYYRTNTATHTTPTATNYNISATQTSQPDDLNTPAAPTAPTTPTTSDSSTNPFDIGTDSNYDGLQCYIRARSYKDGTYSENSDEMAYRTVVTYYFGAAMADATSPPGYRPMDGSQLWIRGGDAISSSTVPGFPLSWEDDWDALNRDKKRAGIRLFTKTTTGSNYASGATWRWITWDINTDAYFDIILGWDSCTINGTTYPSSNYAEVLQYGPRTYSYQRGGWTPYKYETRVLPGKHRYLSTTSHNTGTVSKGTLNFARAPLTRPDITASP